MEPTMEGRDPGAMARAVGRLHAAREASTVRKLEAITRAVADCRAAFAPHAEQILEAARRRLAQGYPPPLRRLCGFGDREVYLNKILGWLFDPAGDHGAGRKPLLALCELIGFDALAEDLRSEDADPEVYAEESPDPGVTSRQPDLMVRTQNAALLVENKTVSGESWPGQYAEYLSILRDWAGPREPRAHLLAPETREQAPGWALPLTHVSVAKALLPLVRDREIPRWTRVAISLVVADLANAAYGPALGEIRRLLDGREGPPTRPHVVRRISHLLEDLDIPAPWMDP